MYIATHEICKTCGDIRLTDDLNDEGICDICAEVDPTNYCCEKDIEKEFCKQCGEHYPLCHCQ